MRTIVFRCCLTVLLFGSCHPTSSAEQKDSADGARAKSDPPRLARICAAKMPAIQQPVLFHTPEADAILSRTRKNHVKKSTSTISQTGDEIAEPSKENAKRSKRQDQVARQKKK